MAGGVDNGKDGKTHSLMRLGKGCDRSSAKRGSTESKFDKSKRLISKLLNLLNIPIGDDPLQNILDAGIVATAGTNAIVADLSQLTTSNLDRILAGKHNLKDAFVQSEAETYKAILRNILLIRQVNDFGKHRVREITHFYAVKGLGVLSKEASLVEDTLCDSAEFTPPTRKAAEYRGGIDRT